MTRPAPLDGIRVIDLTQFLAGPYCTYQLALLGADVVKVEPPGGEPTRRAGGVDELSDEGIGLTFCVQNSDKQLVELDLKSTANVERLLSLVETADVFVQNFRPGVAERLGLGLEAVRARNPRIVYCSISAYGADGPLGGRPAYDHVVQAMCGIMETTGHEDSDPVKVGAPYIDYGTGLNASLAVLAALRERDRTGESQVVDVSMLDTALTLMASNLTHVATTGRDLPKLGNEAATRAPSSGCFVSSDGGWIMLAANNERQFRYLCAALGHPEWADDPRWSTDAARRIHQDELRIAFADVFATQSAASWEAQLTLHDVPASRIRRLSQVLDEGQPATRGLLHEIHIGAHRTPVQVPGVGFLLNGNGLGPRRGPRAAGSDNALFDGEALGTE